MKHYYEHQRKHTGGKFLYAERNKLNPLPGRTFVSIAYYAMPSGETIGIIF